MRRIIPDFNRRSIIAGSGAYVAAHQFMLCRPAIALDTTAHRFEINGNRLEYAGRRIRLLGVGVADPIYVRGERSVDDYRVLAHDWHCNAVRISLHPGHWRQDRAAALKALVGDVLAARAQNLFVLIDWHAIGFPGRYTERVDPAWGLILDAFESSSELALDFWTEISGIFNHDPGIIFELWNEPVFDGRLWKSTGEHWPVFKDLWLRLIDAIRRKSDAVIVVAGGRWAHDLKGVAANLIDDPRVAYSWHCYPNEDRGVADRWTLSLGGLPAVKPVFVTEWGFSRDGHDAIRGTPDDFGKPLVDDIIERLQLHSFAWCYSAGAVPRMLTRTPALNGLTEFGAFAKDHIKTAWRPD